MQSGQWYNVEVKMRMNTPENFYLPAKHSDKSRWSQLLTKALWFLILSKSIVDHASSISFIVRGFETIPVRAWTWTIFDEISIGSKVQSVHEKYIRVDIILNVE